MSPLIITAIVVGSVIVNSIMAGLAYALIPKETKKYIEPLIGMACFCASPVVLCWLLGVRISRWRPRLRSTLPEARTVRR